MKEGIGGQPVAITPATDRKAWTRTRICLPLFMMVFAALPVKLLSNKRTDSRPLLRFFRDEGSRSRTASRNKGKSAAEF